MHADLQSPAGFVVRSRTVGGEFLLNASRAVWWRRESRRTERLDCLVHHLGLALGGRPGASFAKRLMLPVSNDTLLRMVRRRSQRPVEPLKVVGIDDWAFRRNHRYGSIVCDLERRRIVTLLPDRERATVDAWLMGHPGIEVVSRDRGGGYGEAAAKALPTLFRSPIAGI